MSKHVHMKDAMNDTTEKADVAQLEHLDRHSISATNTRATTDGEKASLASHGGEGEVYKRELHKSERRLMWKMDLSILPFAVLLYLSAYLDRGNLGNAKNLGLFKQVLHSNDGDYSLSLALFYIAYIVLSIPGTLLAKQVNPSRSIAAGAFIWSVAATCQAAVKNRGGLFACRLFVGVGESCFGQAMVFYLSYFYTKHDLAKRVGFFISAGAVAGAFGGLIAFGVGSIHHAKIDVWRILFLIEGCPSLLLAIAVFFFMPNRPESTRLFTEDQRTLCLTRLNAQNLQEARVGVDWAGVRRCFLDWKTYVVSIIYSCMNLTLGSVTGFLPTIIQFGFGYTAARAQLMTVPPYAVALVVMLILTTISDKIQRRGAFICIPFAIGILGWAILLALPAKGGSKADFSARYFACICIVTAGYSNIPLVVSWQAGNTGNQSQRAASLGMLNTLGQCLSVAASYLFPTTQSPQFSEGCIVNVVFQTLGLVLTVLMMCYYVYENRRRDKVEGGRPPKGSQLEVLEKHDLAPGFRYVV